VVGSMPAEAIGSPFRPVLGALHASDERVLGYMGTGVAPPIPLSLSRIRQKPDVGPDSTLNPALIY
jgi:hypothetical protein